MFKIRWEDTAGIDISQFSGYISKVNQVLTQMREALSKGYDSDYASLYLPLDPEMGNKISKDVHEIPRDVSCAVLIGIGGSSLGTRAVHEALNGLLYNEITRGIKFYFVESTDSDYVADLYSITEKELLSGKSVLLIVVSKSGTTIETMANFAVFHAQLVKYKPATFNQYIVAITDAGSPLAVHAQKEGYHCYTVPQKVGGRYSVFSSVGLFPLALLGIDIAALCTGAADMVTLGVQEDYAQNPALLSAFFIYYWYTKGYVIHDCFLFSQQSEFIGKWYRQLLAESLGKETIDAKKVGITPTVSIGPTDLHSMAQLHLGGPYNTTTGFVSYGAYAHAISIPKTSGFGYSNKSMQELLHATLTGVERAYVKDKRPFIVYELDMLDAYTIGQLLQMYMMQVMYLGALLAVNPFDQPHVELYKQEIKKILDK